MRNVDDADCLYDVDSSNIYITCAGHTNHS